MGTGGSAPVGPSRLLLTCEHGGHAVPAAYRSLFRGAARLLQSHRGWDPGALQLARHLARALEAPLVSATVSRLVVDLNRSPGHPRVLSERTRRLSAEERARLLERHYVPHRARVRAELERLLRRKGRVVHVAVHSFVPVLDGTPRRAEVGVLYDSARRPEGAFYRAWKRALREREPTWRVLANHPYSGATDGLTTSLRALFPPGRYLGLELEVSQALVDASPERWRAARRSLAASLAEALAR